MSAAVTEAVLADLRLRRAARRVVEQLGTRPTVELVVALVGLAADRAAAAALVERFASLDHDLLRAVGGDRMPPPPVHLVPPR